MKVKDLLGNEYELNVSKKKTLGRKKSSICQDAIDLFQELYPTIRLCQEVAVKIKPGTTLYLDMYAPLLNVAIEVHGRQHYEYVPYYHKYKHRFGRSCLNDTLKKEWCEINKIILVELSYDESRLEWTEKLRRTIG